MNGIGIDPGTACSSIARCIGTDRQDRTEVVGDPSRGILPSLVLMDDVLDPILEAEHPALPFGTGGEWPPEAVVGPAAGSRRLPLAMAVAALSSRSQARRKVESADWHWTTVANSYDQQARREAVAALLRRALQGVSRRESAPIALAVGNDLPLLEQTAIVSHSEARVRLIWRCMAAGLEWIAHSSRKRTNPAAADFAEGERVLHVHLGLDAFEATTFLFMRSKGKRGPEMVVPARSRPSASNTVACPYLGMQLSARGGVGNSRSVDGLWERMFCGTEPAAAALAPLSEVPVSGHASGDVRLGWPTILEAAGWTAGRVGREVDDFLRAVEAIIVGSGKTGVRMAILTGDFFHADRGTETPDGCVSAAARIRAMLRRRSIDAWQAPREAIASGAALFASRRARGWATFLDELPAVEIVVQQSEGPVWKKLLESKHYDAGAPVGVELDQFWLNAGEKHIELPVYVDELGPDTPDVLRTRVDFQHSTTKRTPAKVIVEIEAASGLPVVRAELHGDLNESAEVDWAKDRESCNTGFRKAEYLETLPRTFPPIQERVSGFWWIHGGKYKTVKIKGVEYTGEELGGRLVKLFPGVEENFEPVLKAFQKLAAKREWNSTISKWVAPTDGEGVNDDSDSIDPALEVLYAAVHKLWKKGSLKNTAGRAIAALCWRDARWVAHLMKRCEDLDECAELDYAIAGLGSCLHREADMARAIASMAARLHDKVYSARAKQVQPVGIHTLRALGMLFSFRPDALKGIRDHVADRLAEDITLFIEQTLEYGKFMQKFQAALNALVFLTRRRAHQDGFLGVESLAFVRAVQCCAKVYVAARLAAEGTLWASTRARSVERFKEDLKALRVTGRTSRGRAHEATCHVIDSVDLSRIKLDGTKFPNDPSKLLTLLVQVIEYIEGRGTGILVIDSDDEDDDE